MTPEPNDSQTTKMDQMAALHLDIIAANEALTLSLIRQHELTEAAEAARAELEAEIVVRKKAEGALIISEKLASVARMSAVIAHEINNPLAAVTDLLYLAQTVAGTPNEVLEYLKTADGELKRVAHITRQTLGFYRELNDPTSFRLSSLLDSVLDLLQSKVRAKHAIVENKCDPEVEVTAIYGELRQVFSNLLVNSLDAIQQSGKVTLRASTAKDPDTGADLIRVVVADDGRGISAETLPKIFDPFFTTKGSIGNGLGLWVSKQIIEKHGGELQVRSRTKGEHHGTTFAVVLPARAGPVDAISHA
jgi:two-component system NtrC family sensor kinase